MCLPSLTGDSSATSQLRDQKRSLAGSQHRLAINLARRTQGDSRGNAPPASVIPIKEPRRAG